MVQPPPGWNPIVTPVATLMNLPVYNYMPASAIYPQNQIGSQVAMTQ